MNKILLIITVFLFINCSNHQAYYVESEEAKMDRDFEQKLVIELNKIRAVKKQTFLRVKDEVDRSSVPSNGSAFDAQIRR